MTEEENTVDAPEFGRLLKRTRERLGLSTEDVAMELRLSRFQIQALEEDDWDQLPGTTYARGYLRSYARLLDLDAEKLLEGATTEELEIPPTKTAPDAGESAPEPPSDAAQRSPWPQVWVSVAGVGIAGVLTVYLWQTGWAPESAYNIAGEQVVTGNGGQAAGTGGNETAAGAAPDDPQSGAAATDASGRAPVPTGWRRIVVQFDERSWIDLRDARGERLLYRSVQAGRRMEVEGRPPFRVFLGNARGVQIEYSGQSITPDTMPGRLYARFVLDAPSG